jgi:large subunit ribosomal protein L21
MYAVFQLAGFQYRAEEGSCIQVQVPGGKSHDSDKLEISEVLLLQDEDSVLVGTPFVEGAKIEAEVLSRDRDDKVRVYKYKRRTKYRRTHGHRQNYAEIKISKIVKP